MRPIKVCFLTLAWLAAAAPVHAGEPESDAGSGDLIAQAKRYYGVNADALDCGPSADGVLQVCGKRKRQPRLERIERVTHDRDMKMAAYGNSGIGHGTAGGVTMRICFLQKCPKKLYFIDISALPEAAPGTDADKIAHGLAR